MYDHLEYGMLQTDTYFYRKLRKLISDGYKPDIQILEDGLTESEAFALERKLISHYGRIRDGGCLTNEVEGGTGSSGYFHTEEAKAKIRSASLRQPPASIEERRKLGERSKGNQYAVGHIASTRRPIICFDGLEVVKKYDCIAHVAQDGFLPSNVGSYLKGRKATAYGFHWEYAK